MVLVYKKLDDYLVDIDIDGDDDGMVYVNCIKEAFGKEIGVWSHPKNTMMKQTFGLRIFRRRDGKYEVIHVSKEELQNNSKIKLYNLDCIEIFLWSPFV